MDPFFHTGLSISDSLKTVRKSVLIYETIIVKKIILALSQMELLDEDRGGTHTTKVQNIRTYCILYYELKERYEELRDTGDIRPL